MTDAKALNLSIRTAEAAMVEVARSPTASLTGADLVTCLVMLHQAEQDLSVVRQRLVQELTDRGIPITEVSRNTARRTGEEYRRRSSADPSARST